MKTATINDLYTACSIVEGFSGEENTPREHFESWAYIIRSGAYRTLQGWYGRNAQAMVENGLITADGEVTKKAYKLLEEQEEA